MTFNWLLNVNDIFEYFFACVICAIWNGICLACENDEKIYTKGTSFLNMLKM